MVRVSNNSNTSLTNVVVRDILPTNTTYIANSLTIDGISFTDGITTGGIYLGTLYANQTKIIRFRAQLSDPTTFPYGTTVLTNFIRIRTDQTPTEIEDPLPIHVYRQRIETPPTGSGLLVISIIVAVIASGISYLFLKTKRKPI
jgi:hypothetical protein